MKTVMKLIMLAILLALDPASAVIINSVQTDVLSPGQEGIMRIEVENIFDEDVKEVSLSLDFTNLPFIPLGTSEQSIDEIDRDNDEDFVFRIRAAHDTTPRDYEIPYLLKYEIDNEEKTRRGTIGVQVRANPDLVFTVETEDAVVNKQGKITLRIVNKGFSDARFVSVKILSSDFTLLSNDEAYIGTVDSDDFETVIFDVLFKKTNANFNAIVEYVDFDNRKVVENILLPLTVYSQERASELGIIEKNNTPLYLGIAVTIVLFWILWRTMRKQQRLRRSMQKNEG